MGGELLVLCFIVIIIGGLGSVGGCFIGAILVGADRQLRRLPRAEAGAGLQHPADGRRAAVAAARPLSGGRTMMILSGRSAARADAADADRRRRLRAGAGAVPVPRRQAAQRRRQDLRLRAARRVLRSSARLRRHGLLRPRDVLRRRLLRRRARALRARAELGRGRRSVSRRPSASRPCWRWRSACSRCACRRSSSPW